MNAEPALHENSEVKLHSYVARHIFKPLEDSSSQRDAYGELRYVFEGDTAFFTLNGQGLEGQTYYGLYSGDNFLGLGYALQSGSLNIQGYRPSEMFKGGDFKLFSMDVGTIRPHEQVLK